MILRHGDVRLVPLAEADVEALWAAARPEEVWRLMPTPLGRDRATFDAYLAFARAEVAEGTSEVYAIRRGEAWVGMTRLKDLDRRNERAEVGYTWHHPSVWRTEVNTSAKIALLDRAFEDLGLYRVYFYVDVRNERSQAAVLRLGATREGVSRGDRLLADGYRRDTAVFSLLRPEWAGARASLVARTTRKTPEKFDGPGTS